MSFYFVVSLGETSNVSKFDPANETVVKSKNPRDSNLGNYP